MQDPAEMPARVAALLEARGARNVEVTHYGEMIGGYSRLMARFDASFELDGAAESGTFVLRGDPPPGQAIIETDRTQEFELISAIASHVNTPPARFLDADGEHVGTPALVLEFSPAQSTLPWIEANGTADLPVRLAELAGALHTVPVDAIPASTPRPTTDDVLGEQIDKWRRTADGHVEALPIFHYMAGWLDAHRPLPVPLGLVHNDFSSANMLVDENGDLVIVDLELATVGDPRQDLGYFKAYAQAVPPDLIDADPEGFCARYRELTGYDEGQLNPAVVAYFSVAGVIDVVSQLMASGAALARGEASGSLIAYNSDNILFGHAAWMAATEALEAALDGGT